MRAQPLATTVVGPSKAALTAATSFPFAILFALTAFALAFARHLIGFLVVHVVREQHLLISKVLHQVPIDSKRQLVNEIGRGTTFAMLYAPMLAGAPIPLFYMRPC